MSYQNSNKKDEVTKTRYHGLGLSNQGRGVIKSQSIAFQNSKWSNINSKSKEMGINSNVVPEMTTVYVGRIPTQVTNTHIRKLLGECGTILRWSRQEDPTTKKLSSFGLCEFDSPEGVINAVNVLNGVKISGGQLLVKYQHGIDKEMAKWQSNRINEMLKSRGGDCTIETILNELSASDSKLRISVQRLLAGMSFELDSEQEHGSAEPVDKSSNNDYPEKANKKTLYSNSGEFGASSHMQKSGVLVGFPQNSREKLRMKKFEEKNKEFERKLEDLDDELYEIVKLFPEKMDISNDLTFRYLLETLYESYHNFKFISSSNKRTYDMVSEIIQFDKNLIESKIDRSNPDFSLDSELFDNENDTDSRYKADSVTLYNQEHQNLNDGIQIKSENLGKQGIYSQNGRHQTINDDGTKNDISNNSNITKISINLPRSKQNKQYKNPIETIEKMNSSKINNSDSSLSSNLNLANSNDLINREEVFSAENWKNVLGSVEFENYKEYIEQEMRLIIGNSDQNALDTITNFIIEKFSSKTLIQETINILVQILDTEAESFLRGLFLKILDS
ncbi:RNA-binding domain-containing protein [Cryptosporidium ubiquitum]|uniref:RNA-binding domain-containing protein n=1 Tax=Cryptosporidium ubiquitum TaxID=857276 RepID=A0A1J4MK11_9CRYT|nr:RNA-binding domain-containing protein [Cryptosporidium ubiquitum]OII73356.1 RNA-binding domain-containing protein [Cryptosporidium ubiquitum]